MDERIRLNGLDFPEFDFCLYTIPKNGGTSLWAAAHFLKCGTMPESDKVYSKAPQLMGDGSRRRHRLIVVRDPIDRFVSGYRFLKNDLDSQTSGELDFDSFVGRFPEFYRQGRIRHHLMPQFYFVKGTPITAFTEVIGFSALPALYRRIEELTGKEIPPVHLNASTTPQPKVTHWHLDFLQLFYDVDYAMGYCERTVNPSAAIEQHDRPQPDAPTGEQHALHPR